LLVSTSTARMEPAKPLSIDTGVFRLVIYPFVDYTII